jgi:hypothetical protein
VKVTKKLQVPQSKGKFLVIRGTVSLPRRTLLRVVSQLVDTIMRSIIGYRLPASWLRTEPGIFQIRIK